MSDRFDDDEYTKHLMELAERDGRIAALRTEMGRQDEELAAMTQRAESLEELLREIRGDAVIVSSRGSATYWPNRIDDLLKEGKE